MDLHISFNLDGLNKLIKHSEEMNKLCTKVGILGDNNPTYEGGITTAEIASHHEFGTIKIPKRSWLMMPLEKYLQDNIKEFHNKIFIALRHGNIKEIFMLVGMAAEAIIQDAFNSGGFGEWKPLAPITIKRKGSSAILIDTAQLRKSVTSKVEKNES